MFASFSGPSCLVSKTVPAALRVANPDAASLTVGCWVAGIFLPYKREDWRRYAFGHATCCHDAANKYVVRPSIHSRCKTLSQLPQPDRAKPLT